MAYPRALTVPTKHVLTPPPQSIVRAAYDDRIIKNGPGMHLNLMFTAGGRYIEAASVQMAKWLGLGPAAAVEAIEAHFSDGGTRVFMLDKSWEASLPNHPQSFANTAGSKAALKLHNLSSNLLQYAESACTPTELHRLTAIRYLAGILELPTFWAYWIDNDLHSISDDLCTANIRLLEDLATDCEVENHVLISDLMALDPEGIHSLLLATVTHLPVHQLVSDDPRLDTSLAIVEKLMRRVQMRVLLQLPVIADHSPLSTGLDANACSPRPQNKLEDFYQKFAKFLSHPRGSAQRLQIKGKGPDITGYVRRDPEQPPLGSSAGSVVYRGLYEWTDPQSLQMVGMKVAVKHISSAPHDRAKTEELMRNMQLIRQEVATWRYLDHPNITKFLGIAQIETNGPRCLVSRYMRRNKFLDYMGRHPDLKREKAIEIALGLQYLHTRTPPVIHGDIKPENILISDSGTAQINDFGMSRILGVDGFAEKAMRNMRYAAPELLLLEADEPLTTAESDIFSLAMLLLVVSGLPRLSCGNFYSPTM
ncbi:hypothetical protein HWV62_21108 [Athelia sp. TMB]|nr:hypothetical protein HWV62_21108 [Athelia sp. TMB]